MHDHDNDDTGAGNRAGQPQQSPRGWLGRWLREPLLHFAVLGVLTYAVYAAVSGPPVSADDGDGRTIVVDRAHLLTYLQFQMRRFEDGYAANSLDAMTPDELKRLVHQYVRDEVLYRQAKALGMAKDDFVIRNRMIQKIEFVNHSMAEDGVNPTKAQERAYYEKHRDQYRDPAVVTFTHVFFDNRDGGKAEALARAKAAKQALNAGHVAFDRGPRHGDRFLYNVNYVESTEGLVASHFGQAMAKQVFALKPDSTHWRGPFESPYGAHLVMETVNEPARTLPFDQVADRVADDLRRQLIKQREEQVVDDVIAQYHVEVKVHAKGHTAVASRTATGGDTAGATN